MQNDFHYYATYCAALLAGYNHSESLDICYSAQFVDWCSRTLLSGIKAPPEAATTTLNLELVDTNPDLAGLQMITRIWTSFHFLPGNIYAHKKGCGKRYLNKYRLICNTNSNLLVETVKLAKGSSLQAAGMVMHVLADTWAHKYFSGNPSLAINNIDGDVTEILEDGERIVSFKHTPGSRDNIEKGKYSNTIYQNNENSIMNLGHGRLGHMPDYSFLRYRYMPAWANYDEFLKDNPSDYYNAFCQMIYAMKYLRGEYEAFEKDHYDYEAAADVKDEIQTLLNTRQTEGAACLAWKALGEKLSGETIPNFSLETYQQEYIDAVGDEKDNTFLGKFIIAALKQKSMVTNKIYKSGNRLAGYSIDFEKKGFKGIKAYMKLVEHAGRGSDE